MNFNGLYVLFDLKKTGAIGRALQDLKQQEQVEVNQDNTMRITASGEKELETCNKMGGG